MIKAKRILTTLFSAGALAGLTACGGPEGDFETAINASLAEDKKCYSLQRSKSVDDFPLRVQRGLFGGDELDPILAGLQEAGMIVVDTSDSGYKTVDEISLTKKGQKEGVWDEQDGFCIGKPQVTEIVRYTFGNSGQNENEATVEFTWQFENLPSWVERESFASIRGMIEPAEGTAQAQKSSDGWHAYANTGGSIFGS